MNHRGHEGTRRILVSVGVWLCLSAFLFGAPKPPVQVLIFTNVNVVNVRDGSIAQGLTVVIKRGHITGVAKLGFVAPDHNIQIINANGKYMTPGLWDMHVHSAFVSPAWDEKVIYPLYIANGVTGVRDMGGDPDVLESRRDRIETGTLMGPRLILAGPFLAGAKGDKQTISVNTPEEARQAVDAVKFRSSDMCLTLLASAKPLQQGKKASST
jgi:hypothetical protein